MPVPNGTKDIFRGTTHIDSKNESSLLCRYVATRAILITYAGVLLQAQKCFSQSFDTTLTANRRLSEINYSATLFVIAFIQIQNYYTYQIINELKNFKYQ